ncbi:MAG: hypothetical protein WDM76_13640 [Limisphaerales bacterium]
MSTVSDLDLDLESLFQPAWTQEKPAGNRFEKFTGNEGVKPERRFSDKPANVVARVATMPVVANVATVRRAVVPSLATAKAEFFLAQIAAMDRREPVRREAPAPLPDLTVTILPGENGVESLARQIRMTGRAYPLFQIAQLVLDKPERYSVQLAVKKKADGTVAQPIFVCALDETPWLTEDEAIAHVLKNHFATFYQVERTATEPPRGVYTFVAQCAISGVILGPPNHHDYQNQLRKLHSERFSRMPFDAYKAGVKIVRDEAVVKKWIEDQSFKTEYTVLNVPEPLKLANLEEVEKHFRATHKETIIKSVEKLVVGGVLSRNLRSRGLQQLIRQEWEAQRHFPLQLASTLSHQFAHHGLQFFKVNKTVTHVAVARPQFLDLEATPVSENIKRIVSFINEHPKCTRRKLLETLAPTPQPTIIEVKPDAAPAPAEATPEQTAIIADLHWLVHQGHVLEFADGRLETAKKPLPKPVKQEKKPTETKAAEEKPATEGEVPVAVETAPQAEVVAQPTAEAPVSIEAAAVEPVADCR